MDNLDVALAPSRPDTASRARRAIARRLIDVVSMPESLISTQERRVAADLLFDLLREGDTELRRRAAQRFAHLNEGPKQVIRMLARDEIEVARPILEECKSLDSADLSAVARQADLEHRLLIARRKDVSETVGDVLMEQGEPEVIDVLLRNADAKLSEASIDRAVSLSRLETSFTPLLLKRQELRPADAFLMFWWANHDERIVILRRFAVQRSVLLDSAADLFRVAVDEDWSDQLALRTLRLIERRQRDRVALAESVHESLELAIEAAVTGLTPQRADEIAALSGVRPATGALVFNDYGAEALAVFCKATGLKRRYFEMLWRALRGDDAQERAAEYEKGAFAFDILSPPKAQTVLRYWDWAIGGSLSVETLTFLDGEHSDDPLGLSPASRASTLLNE